MLRAQSPCDSGSSTSRPLSLEAIPEYLRLHAASAWCMHALQCTAFGYNSKAAHLPAPSSLFSASKHWANCYVDTCRCHALADAESVLLENTNMPAALYGRVEARLQIRRVTYLPKLRLKLDQQHHSPSWPPLSLQRMHIPNAEDHFLTSSGLLQRSLQVVDSVDTARSISMWLEWVSGRILGRTES